MYIIMEEGVERKNRRGDVVEGRSGEDVEDKEGKERRGYSGSRKEWRGCRGEERR